MTSFLFGVPGQLKAIADNITTLLSRISSTVAGYLDASISSRAPSSTALNNTVWTSTRAAFLDTIVSVYADTQALKQRPNHSPPTLTHTPSKHVDFDRLFAQSSGLQATSPTPAVGYVTSLDIVGRGVVNFLAVCNSAVMTSGFQGCRVTVDGVVIYNSTTVLTAVRDGIVIVGMLFATGTGSSILSSGVAFGEIPFLTEFKVEHYYGDGTGQMQTYVSYRKTS